MGRPILSPLYIQIHQLVISTLFLATLHIFIISFLVTKSALTLDTSNLRCYGMGGGGERMGRPILSPL